MGGKKYLKNLKKKMFFRILEARMRKIGEKIYGRGCGVSVKALAIKKMKVVIFVCLPCLKKSFFFIFFLLENEFERSVEIIFILLVLMSFLIFSIFFALNFILVFWTFSVRKIALFSSPNDPAYSN